MFKILKQLKMFKIINNVKNNVNTRLYYINITNKHLK